MIKLAEALGKCNECGRDWNHGHDHEASMAKNELRDMISNASKIDQMVKEGDNLPGWISAYISLAADYMHSVAEYMAGETSRMDEPGPGYSVEEATVVRKTRGDAGRMHSASSRDYGVPYTPKTDYRVGQKFHHKEHGTGTIIEVEPSAPRDQAIEKGATIYVEFVRKDQHDNNVKKNVKLKVRTLDPSER
jgi:hypothetical protein